MFKMLKTEHSRSLCEDTVARYQALVAGTKAEREEERTCPACGFLSAAPPPGSPTPLAPSSTLRAAESRSPKTSSS